MKKLIVQFTFIVLAISMVFISGVNAATIDATDCTEAAINTAISAASTGDTITVKGGASCTATWSGNINIGTKQLKLIGGGNTTTLITNGSISVNTNSRLSGFGFTGTTIGVDGDGWRIDNNKFTYTTRTVAIQVTGYRGNAHPTGLIDSNTFTLGAILVYGFPDTEKGMENATYLWSLSTGLGTATNVVFIENNIFTSGASGVYYIDCMDANYGGRFVFRYNTLTNTHTEFHGIQSAENRGNPRWEIYSNSYTTDVATYNAILARGGTGVIWGNTFSGSYTLNINTDNQTSTRYGDYSCTPNSPYGYLDNVPCDGNNPRDGNRASQEGYPCRDQIGRGQDVPIWYVGDTYAQSLSPAYFWNNINSGSDVSAPTITRESPLTSCIPSNVDRHLLHLAANRDFYYSSGVQTNATTPFDGTVGVGYGTLANRPVTCTHAPVTTGLTAGEIANGSGAGVSYWATDTSTLYRCTDTNTWTLHYTPYTCPHPLADPSGDGQCNYGSAGTEGYNAAADTDTFLLSISKSGDGSGTVTEGENINCNGQTGETCSYLYDSNEIVLTATPSTGSYFTGWSGGGCSGTGNCTTSITAHTTITASFTNGRKATLGAGGGTITVGP